MRTEKVVLGILAPNPALAGCGRAQELWRTDGTAAGTVLVRRFPPSRWLNWMPPVPVGDETYFTLTGRRFLFSSRMLSGLWTSDGTADGTVNISRIGTELAVAGDTGYWLHLP